ncbi:MAG: hypothetical protein LBI19_04045 [Oscillospiraceae bacterium]|jgi:hypothetical protein|nr:hypothetical protein [Oscillospiraceae bacterium]
MDNKEQLEKARKEIAEILEHMKNGIEGMGVYARSTESRLVEHIQEHKVFTIKQNEQDEQFIRLKQEITLTKGEAVSEEETPQVLISKAKITNIENERKNAKKRDWPVLEIFNLLVSVYMFFNSETEEEKEKALEGFLSALDDVMDNYKGNEHSVALPQQEQERQQEQQRSEPGGSDSSGKSEIELESEELAKGLEDVNERIKKYELEKKHGYETYNEQELNKDCALKKEIEHMKGLLDGNGMFGEAVSKPSEIKGYRNPLRGADNPDSPPSVTPPSPSSTGSVQEMRGFGGK